MDFLTEETMKTLRTFGILVGISGLASLSRSILSEDRRSFRGFARGLILAIFVGETAQAIMQALDYPLPMQSGVIAIAAFVADDILLGIISAAATLRNNPQQIIDWILRRK